MIKVKVKHYFKCKYVFKARFCASLENWWLRSTSAPKESNFGNILSLKTFLRWDQENSDDEWVDRDGVDLLLYAVFQNDAEVVESILKGAIDVKKRLNTLNFEHGDVEFGIPAKTSILHIAMFLASVNIVRLLLESGANPLVTDKNGIDSLMYACTFGRDQNVKFWLDRFPSWDLSRGTTVNGSTALHTAVYFGRNKMKTVQAVLQSARASLDVLNHGGASILSNAVSSVDSNVDVVRYLLSQRLKYGVNHRRQSQTVKWKTIHSIARGLFRTRMVRSGLLAQLASDPGSTALQYAASRGDVEIVELLMEHGAQPSIKNFLGRDVFSYCESFPEIKGAIQRMKREAQRTPGKSVTNSTRDSKHDEINSEIGSFTLQRRFSTATDATYDMYLLGLSRMMKLFGSASDRKKNAHLCHQNLLRKGKLTRFEDLPLGAFVMFISHQWNAFDHPDPSGRQLQTLCTVVRKLRDGVFKSVETSPFHVLVYKKNHTTPSSEWKQLLLNAYVWYDWFSQPQPTMEMDPVRRCEEKKQLDLAVKSMASYVERADTLVVLTPPTLHKTMTNPHTGRRALTCYRT